MHTSIPVVYPHRVSFFNNENCDVCGSSCDTNFIGVIKYIGFRCCKSDNCHNTIKEWLQLTTKDKEELENKYGTNIKIQRSNDSIENSWFITSNAFQEHKDSPFWVEVTNSSNKTKFVTLGDLDALNIA